MIQTLLLFALTASPNPPPDFAQVIRPIMQDVEAGITRTAEFMRQEHGRELGPLWLNVQSFSGYDVLVTTATTEYRPADRYRPAATSALSMGQTLYSFSRKGGEWVLEGQEAMWTS